MFNAGITLKPIDGWGFMENIDGKLASRFSAKVIEEAADFGHGIKGWRAVATDGKYCGAGIKITPRSHPFNGVVVLNVKSTSDGEKTFSGMAISKGLKPGWMAAGK